MLPLPSCEYVRVEKFCIPKSQKSRWEHEFLGFVCVCVCVRVFVCVHALLNLSFEAGKYRDKIKTSTLRERVPDLAQRLVETRHATAHGVCLQKQPARPPVWGWSPPASWLGHGVVNSWRLQEVDRAGRSCSCAADGAPLLYNRVATTGSGSTPKCRRPNPLLVGIGKRSTRCSPAKLSSWSELSTLPPRAGFISARASPKKLLCPTRGPELLPSPRIIYLGIFAGFQMLLQERHL